MKKIKELKKINEVGFEKKDLPIKVLQFGEGNFLRAFIDWQIQQMNNQSLFNGNVTIIQPLENGLSKMLQEQDNLYTVLLEGLLNGEKIQQDEVITCINETLNPYDDYESFLALGEIESLKVIFSNTTEAGIAFDSSDKGFETIPNSFPGKLTALLYQRYQKGLPGLIIIPCELINHNGTELKRMVLKYSDYWKLEEGFENWIVMENEFCSTLVDRIVPGYPRDNAQEICENLGYVDNLLVKSEAFHLFVIEGSSKVESILPFKESGLNVIVTDNMQPYRERKVRLLNGPHTTMTPLGLLSEIETVGEMMEDPEFSKFISDEMYDEIAPKIELPEAELAEYIEAIKERFSNPFVRHELQSIALNSISKYTTRLLPTVLQYLKEGQIPPRRITLGLAGLLVIYGDFDQIKIQPSDMEDIIEKFRKISLKENYIESALSQIDFWGEDLTNYPVLVEMIKEDMDLILSSGVRSIVQEINNK